MGKEYNQKGDSGLLQDTAPSSHQQDLGGNMGTTFPDDQEDSTWVDKQQEEEFDQYQAMHTDDL